MKKKVSSAAPRGGRGRGRGGRGRGGARKDEKFSEDSFFMAESKKRRKISDDADVIDSGESDDERGYGFRGGSDGEDGDGGDAETADEVRQRVAMAQLDKYRRIAKEEEDEDEDDDDEEGIDRIGEKEGLRDSLVAKILQQEQLEESGRVRRAMASRYCIVLLFH